MRRFIGTALLAFSATIFSLGVAEVAVRLMDRPQTVQRKPPLAPEDRSLPRLHDVKDLVKRGQRGTRPVTHKKGELVHFGHRGVREVPVRLYREDWG